MDELVIKIARSVHKAGRYIERLWRRGGSLLPPIVKSVLFGLLLWHVQGSEFAVWPVILFFAVALVSYMQPVSKAFTMRTALFVILALAILLTSRFTISLPAALHASSLGQLMFAAVFGFLFFILLGVKNVILVRRRQWYTVLFIALIYGISLLFFTGIADQHILRDLIFLELFLYLLLKEYFSVQEHASHRAMTVMTLTMSVILLELAWGLSLLPLGFSKGASVLTLCSIILVGIVDRYIRGTLTARFLRLTLFLFVALVAAVFMSVRWLI